MPVAELARKFSVATLLPKWFAWAFDLAHDPEARAQSIHPSPPTPEAHAAWLEHPRYHRFVGLVEGESEPIGLCWLDATPHSYSIISVNMTPDWRGQGYGTKLVSLVTGAGQALRPGKPIRAYIKPENLASRRCFERAHYHYSHLYGELLVYVA